MPQINMIPHPITHYTDTGPTTPTLSLKGAYAKTYMNFVCEKRTNLLNI